MRADDSYADEHPEEVTLGGHSLTDSRPWDACACYLGYLEIEERMNRALKMEEQARVERDEAAAKKAIAEARALAAETAREA